MTRTNDDTWDLATSVGATATMVAAARAIATDEGAIDDPFAGPLVRAVGVDFLTRWATGELTAADLDDEGTAWGLGQMPAAMAARTRYFDQFFADAAAAGIRQAVILASGLDARAYRLDWPADMTGVRDRPAGRHRVQDHDAGGSRRRADGEPPHGRGRPARGLAERPSRRRASTPMSRRPGSPRACIGYLPPEAQDRLLDAVTALGAPGSRLASEAVPDMTDVDPEETRERMREATAKWREHGFDLDFSELGFQGERHDVGEYLDARGWTSVATPMAQLLASHGFDEIPETDDARQTMNGVTYYTSTLG